MKIIICTKEQFREKQGIHSLEPDLWYLNDALETAHRDNFECIYLHYLSVGCGDYAVPYDVMNRLFELGVELEVEFTHPASPDKFAESVLKRVK